MKRQIRNGVFETNSSSIHSIAIPRECEPAKYVSFHIGEFGWEWDEADAADYLYTAIYLNSETESDAKEKIERLKDILNKHGIDYHFGKAKTSTHKYGDEDYFYLDNGYIDHGRELSGFVEELLNDEDKLVRFISGGLVFTGNDNCAREEDGFVERNQEYLDHYDWRTKKRTYIKNEYYMSDHEDYEWYEKGN